jgi:hypothetical protein
MTDTRKALEEANGILEELSNLQTWCVLMARKDSGGLPAADLIQRARILIIEMRRTSVPAAILKTKAQNDE